LWARHTVRRNWSRSSSTCSIKFSHGLESEMLFFGFPQTIHEAPVSFSLHSLHRGDAHTRLTSSLRSSFASGGRSRISISELIITYLSSLSKFVFLLKYCCCGIMCFWHRFHKQWPHSCGALHRR